MIKRAVSVSAVMVLLLVAGGAASPVLSVAKETTASQDGVQAPLVEITKLTPGGGDWRCPAVAEDSKGNRLVIFRSAEGTKYSYVYCPKGGTWTSPRLIADGNQPPIFRWLYANIVVDSTDRFHCEWEDAYGAVYASFKDGVWTTPVKPSLAGGSRYDFTSTLAVRSTDEVITVDCEIIGLSKDLWAHTKKKNDTQFSAPFNLTRDALASTQPSAAVDDIDNLWVAWKSDYPIPGKGANESFAGIIPEDEIVPDNLVILLGQFNTNNETVGEWKAVSQNPGWAFLPQVAVNNEGKVMVEWAQSTARQQMSRLYDPKTGQMGPIVSLNMGLFINPWHNFFSRLVAHGKDFYAAIKDPGGVLYLMKFDEAASSWSQVAKVSDRSAYIMSLYSGYTRMLIAWESTDDPADIYLTAVEVPPPVPSTQQLTLQATPGGTTTPAPGTYTHPRRAVVNITAVPDLAFKLASWSGDASGNAPSIAVTMDADKTVKANFQFVIQPPLNFQVEKKVERGLFNAFYLNLLTWEANILNTQQGDVVAAYRIYRKPRTDAAAPWTRLAEVAPTIFSYVDSKLLKTADYIYTITTVHRNGDESAYY